MSGRPAPDVNVKASNEQPRLTSWELVEDHFVRHDTNVVEGFNKDIDTLLVFAGLFSAVLSAFVIVSLMMLQPDTGQTSVSLLLQLSAQTANSSQPAASLPDFQAPRSAIWINSLWFLSLILSLTSALFGMIAKQWLREYLEWATTSWLPQRTITLRQKRSEAFDEWKVSGIIAAIPALLEVALILFFAGLIIFLWTVNLVVARVAVAAISTSIGLVVFATVLPVFRRRCPYKSPTGWACLWVVRPLAQVWEGLREYAWLHSPAGSLRERLSTHLEVDCERYKSWRERDFASGGDDGFNTELSDVLRGAEVRLVYKGGIVITFDSVARADNTLGDLAALDRAFRWIHDMSQNEALLDAVVRCAETRATDSCFPLALLAFDFSAACQALEMEPASVCASLAPLYDVTLEGDQVAHASLRHDWRVWPDTSRLGYHLDRLRCTRPHLVIQLAKTLLHDLSKLLGEIDLGRAVYENDASARFIVRIAALCACLVSEVDGDRTFLDCLVPLFLEVLNSNAECRLPGLKSTIFELLSLHPESIVKRGDGPPNVVMAKLALSASAQNTPATWTRDSADLFCHISAATLRETKWNEDRTYDAAMQQLFIAMARVVDGAHSRGWKNGGSHINLYDGWVVHLHRLYCHDDGIDRAGLQRLSFPRELIASLDRCRAAGLLTEDQWDNLPHNVQQFRIGFHTDLFNDLLATSQRFYAAGATAGIALLHDTNMRYVEQAHEASPTHTSSTPSIPHSAALTSQCSSGQLASQEQHGPIPVTGESTLDPLARPLHLAVDTDSMPPSHPLPMSSLAPSPLPVPPSTTLDAPTALSVQATPTAPAPALDKASTSGIARDADIGASLPQWDPRACRTSSDTTVSATQKRKSVELHGFDTSGSIQAQVQTSPAEDPHQPSHIPTTSVSSTSTNGTPPTIPLSRPPGDPPDRVSLVQMTHNADPDPADIDADVFHISTSSTASLPIRPSGLPPTQHKCPSPHAQTLPPTSRDDPACLPHPQPTDRPKH